MLRELNRPFSLALGILLASAAALTPACTTGRAGPPTNDQEFLARTDDLARAYESRDVGKISSFYAPDILTLTFDAELNWDTGRAESEATIRRTIANLDTFSVKMAPEIEAFKGDGKVWTVRGFDAKATTKSGATLTWLGRHSAIWEKQNNRWVVVNENFLGKPVITRPTLPPPPPPAVAAAPSPSAEPAPIPPPPAVSSDTLRDVFFDVDESDIRPDQQARLAADAEWLKSNPSVRITIEGHCDERQTDAYNMALGQRRAESTKAFLVDRGVEASRLTTISYGKRRPFEQGHDEEAWQANRRAHFVVTK
jgi:peptidoglycan-associated lipoprotein